MARGKYDRSAMRRPIVTASDPFNQTARGHVDELAETKRQLAAALERIVRLEKLCRTHGLWIDG